VMSGVNPQGCQVFSFKQIAAMITDSPGVISAKDAAAPHKRLPFARNTYFLRYCFYGTMTT
jgi:hypothetical protein